MKSEKKKKSKINHVGDINWDIKGRGKLVQKQQKLFKFHQMDKFAPKMVYNSDRHSKHPEG